MSNQADGLVLTFLVFGGINGQPAHVAHLTTNLLTNPYRRLTEHPLSAAWSVAAGVFDKRSKGITLHEGMILDGRKRLSDGSTHLVSLGSVDPVGFILDKYSWLESSPEKTEAVAKCSLWLPPGRPSKSRIRAVKSGVLSLMTAEEMAKVAGVSVRTVVRMKADLRDKDREREKAMETDIEAAQARIAELEDELSEYRLALQDMVDRGMTESDMSDALLSANRRNKMLRERLRSSDIALRGQRRTAKLLEKQLKRAQRSAELATSAVREIEQG